MAGVVTIYTLDLNTGLTQVLADGTHTYLYGYGRIAQDDGADVVYFLPDALGSVRQLADDGGEVTLAQSFEPYGDLLTSAGTGTTSYGFTGELFDGSTGLLYLRARLYSATQGRFTSKDTWPSEYERPLSLNRWAYVDGNPVKWVDPTGHTPCELLPPPDRADAGCLGPQPPAVFRIVRFNYGTPHSENSVTVQPREWTLAEQHSIAGAALDVGRALSRTINRALWQRYWLSVDECVDPITFSSLTPPTYVDPFRAFLSVYGGPVTFLRKSETSTADGIWAVTRSRSTIWLWANASERRILQNPRWIVHELGHAFENATLDARGAKFGRNALPPELLNRDFGFHGGIASWQYSGELGSGEIFADMFIGWVYNRWEETNGVITSEGQGRQTYMNNGMPLWVMMAYDRFRFWANSP